jgi:hypothetical protein
VLVFTPAYTYGHIAVVYHSCTPSHPFAAKQTPYSLLFLVNLSLCLAVLHPLLLPPFVLIVHYTISYTPSFPSLAVPAAARQALGVVDPAGLRGVVAAFLPTWQVTRVLHCMAIRETGLRHRCVMRLGATAGLHQRVRGRGENGIGTLINLSVSKTRQKCINNIICNQN